MKASKKTTNGVKIEPMNGERSRWFEYRDALFDFLDQLWHEEIEAYNITVHSCFLFVSALAFFFFMWLASTLESQGFVTPSEIAVENVNYLIGWSNVFINLLFLLIVIEISQYISVHYQRYRVANL